MATTKKTKIVDSMKITVVKKENPFGEGTVQAKHAAAVLGANGKLVSDAKKKGADAWTIREMANRKIVKVGASA